MRKLFFQKKIKNKTVGLLLMKFFRETKGNEKKVNGREEFEGKKVITYVENIFSE